MGLPVLQMGIPTLPGPLGVTPDLSRTYVWASRPLPDLELGLPTTPGPLGVPSDPSRTSGWASRTFGWASRTSGWAHPEVQEGLGGPPVGA